MPLESAKHGKIVRVLFARRNVRYSLSMPQGLHDLIKAWSLVKDQTVGWAIRTTLESVCEIDGYLTFEEAALKDERSFEAWALRKLAKVFGYQLADTRRAGKPIVRKDAAEKAAAKAAADAAGD